MTYRNPAYLLLCKGRPCIACGADDGTIVPAHRNYGKSMSMKSSDAWTIPLCVRCHSNYDSYVIGDADASDEWFAEHFMTHIDNLLTEGRLTVDGKPQKDKAPKPSSKIIRHSGKF
jgi:hypothetical protein